MDVKKFSAISKVLTVFMAVAVGSLFAVGLYLPALAVMVLGFLISSSMRSKVKGVLADERDILLGGRAATVAVSLYCWIIVVVATSLHSLSSRNAIFEPVATALMFSALGLIALQAFMTRFPRITKLSTKTWAVLYASIAAVAIVIVVAIKLFSVGYWSCENGNWVKHNEPAVAAPTMPCPVR